MDYSRQDDAIRFAALSPEEQATSDAYERGDGNRAELIEAINSEQDPTSRQLLRREYARLFDGAPVPAAELTPTTAKDEPAGMSLADFRAKYGSSGDDTGESDTGPFAMYGINQRQRSTAAPEANTSGNVSRGFQVSMGQLGPTLKGVAGLIGASAEQVVGEGGIATGFKNWGFRGYQEGMGKLQPLQKDNDSLDTAWGKAVQGDLGALLEWGEYGFGYSLGQLGESAAMAVVGGLVGGATAGPGGAAAGATGGLVAKGAAKSLARQMIEKAVAKEAAELAAASGGKLAGEALTATATKNVAKRIGEVTALGAFGTSQELGQIYGDAEEQAAKEGRKLTGADLARVWGAGLAAGGVEGVTDAIGLGAISGRIKLPGPGGKLARGATGGLVLGGGEAGTEITQTALERFGAGQPLTGEEANKAYIDAGGLGAIGGQVVGTISGVVHKPDQLTTSEHTARADAQRDEAARKLGSTNDIGEMIDAASTIATRPSEDVRRNTAKIEQQTRLDEMLDDPEYKARQQARLTKLQEGIDIHGSLLDEQNRSTPPLANPDGVLSSPLSDRVASQLATDLPGRTTATTLPEVNATPTMTGRYDGALRPDVNEGRAAAGLQPAATALTEENMPEPAVRWIDKTPLTDETTARQHLAQLRERAPEFNVNPNDMVLGKHPTVPGAWAVRTVPDRLGTNKLPRVTQAQKPALTTISDGRKEPVTVSAVGQYKGTRRFADLTPMTAEQAQERLQKLQFEATKNDRDPLDLEVVPHPGNKTKFAILNVAEPVKLQQTSGVKVDQSSTPMVDPVAGYVAMKRATNTPAARAFIQAYDAGRIKREDVLRAAAADANQNTDTQIHAESRGFVAEGDRKGVPRVPMTMESEQTAKVRAALPVDQLVTAVKAKADQRSTFDLGEHGPRIQRLAKRVVRFASGLTAIGDLAPSTRGAGGHHKQGVGIDIGELSDNGMDVMANAALHMHTQLFVDSGAFGAFRRGLKSGNFTPMDFDAILAKYDKLLARIEEHNEVEENQYPRPMLVMPDIVGDQAGSLDLIRKHKTWISVEAKGNVSRPIIPIQTGELSMADAYREIVSILGTDKFIVGIPSNEAAVSPAELSEFLRDAKPKAIHILGAASESTLTPRLRSIVEANHDQHMEVTADASPIRSKVLDAVKNGAKRGDFIENLMVNPKDPGAIKNYDERGKDTPVEDITSMPGRTAEERAASLEHQAAAALDAYERGDITEDEFRAWAVEKGLVNELLTAAGLAPTDLGETSRPESRMGMPERDGRGRFIGREHEVGLSFAPPTPIGPEIGKIPTGKSVTTPTAPEEEGTGPTQPGGPLHPPSDGTVPPAVGTTFTTNHKSAALKKAVRSRDLAKIIAALEQSASPTVKYIAEKAKALIGKTTFSDPSKERWGPTTAGVYHPATDSIAIHPKYDGDEWTVAHELVHALSAHAIFHPSAEQKAIVEEIRKLREHVVKALGVEWKRYYGTNPGANYVHEFLAEGFTSPEFQKRLASIPYGNKSVWTKFVDLIAKLIGMEGRNTALSELLTLGDKLITLGRPAKLKANVNTVFRSEGRAEEKLSVGSGASSAQNVTYAPVASDQRYADNLAGRLTARARQRDPGAADVVLTAVGPATPAQRAAQTLAARLFGKPVVFVKFGTPASFNGANLGNTVFVNVDSSKPILAVLGHELLHTLSHSQPQLYAQLVDRMRGLLHGVDRYADNINAKRRKAGLDDITDADLMTEELIADIVGDHFMDQEFWDALADQQPKGFKALAKAVLQWLDDTIAKVTKFRPFGTDLYLSDLKAAREAVVDTMRQFSGAEVGAVPDVGDVKFSPIDERDPKALREYARQWEDYSSDEWGADSFSWSERQLTREEMLRLIGGEKGIYAGSRYIDESKSDLTRPVVVAMTPDGPNLWDGVHRVVSALRLGKTVPAVVGKFVEEKLSVVESRATTEGNIDADQRHALVAVFGAADQRTLREKALDTKKGLGKWLKERLAQGLVDQFDALKKLGGNAYLLARMSRGADGTTEALLSYGKPFINSDGVADVKIGDGGFVQTMTKLQGETQRFLQWIAGQRMGDLTALGKENLATPADIKALLTLNQGTMPDGSDRAKLYAEMLREFTEYNDAVVAIAQKSGLIDARARALFKSMPYVPFYRVLEDGPSGPSYSSALTGQAAWRKLKGGTHVLHSDLLENVLKNWAHVIDSSAKNRAGIASIDAAAQLAGVVEQAQGPVAGTVRIMRDGQSEYYFVNDANILEAISAMHYAMPAFFKPFATAKRMLTTGVTSLPGFKIKNLIRDSVSAMAVSGLSPNAVSNVAQGLKTTDFAGAFTNMLKTATGNTPASFMPQNQTFASMLASGGVMRFASATEGNRASHVNKMVGRTVRSHGKNVILDRKGWRKITGYLGDLGAAYEALGDTGEQANRVALYEQLRKQGKSHAEASFMARDLMDFSMQGKWPVIRFLVQTVPFLNARLQGLYKLGRGAKEDPKRFGYVAGAVTLASLALWALYKDDDDWKKREDWDRDSYWWFKIGGTAYRIPKPFEVGSIGTVAERTAELYFDRDMTPRRFGQRMGNMLQQTFAFNPTPQAIKPLMELWANKDTFTGRDIESAGMEHLLPEDRYNSNTSTVAKTVGSFGLGVSPLQFDHLMTAYFGGVAALVNGAIDVAAHRGARPDTDKTKFFTSSMVSDLPTDQSRYVQQLYDRATEVDQAYESYQHAVQQGDLTRARKLMAENRDMLIQHKPVDTVRRQLSDINVNIKRVDASTLSDESKRTLLKSLRARRNALAERLDEMLPAY